MTPSRRPARPRARRLALGASLLLVPVLVPAPASADYTSAHQWAGGVLSPARQAGASKYASTGTLVSLVTSPTKARLSLTLANSRCSTTEQITGTVTPGVGGDAEHLVLSVDGTRRIRNRREHLDYAVSLRSAAPGVLAGTASVRGTFLNDRRRKIRCNVTAAVTLRSRSALSSPLQPLPTDPALPRVGVLSSTIKPRVEAAIAITKRADGFHHAIWSERVRCVSGRKRTSFETVNFAARFRVGANGRFNGREVVRRKGKVKKGRFTFRYVGTIKGRIDADGIARGRIATTSRRTETGYYVSVCKSGSRPFAAAP